MVETVLVLALCGVAGGYLLGCSALFADRRDCWVRRRDLLDAALHDELDDLVVPFGSIDGDMDVLPGVPTGQEPAERVRKWRWRWRFNYLLSCNVCSGWWAVAAAAVVWQTTAEISGAGLPVSWPALGPVALAACALHTIVTRAGVKTWGWA